MAHQQISDEALQRSHLDRLPSSLFGSEDAVNWDELYADFAETTPETVQYNNGSAPAQPLLSVTSRASPVDQDHPVAHQLPSTTLDGSSTPASSGFPLCDTSFPIFPSSTLDAAGNPAPLPQPPKLDVGGNHAPLLPLPPNFDVGGNHAPLPQPPNFDVGRNHPPLMSLPPNFDVGGNHAPFPLPPNFDVGGNHAPLPPPSNFEIASHANANILALPQAVAVSGDVPLQQAGTGPPSFHLSNPTATRPDRFETPSPPSKRRRRRCFISHRREHKGSVSNHPSQFYDPIPGHPKSWGFNPDTGRDTFAYTDKGELEIKMTYSAAQLFDFIKRPRREGEHLILWIQNPPAQVNHRYPRGVESSVCRWEKCPIKKNTIFTGHWRVALDERGDEHGEKYDPFHNAGYVHLFCLENMFDLIALFLDPAVDIRPERRRMAKEERNPMMLTRDHAELNDVLEQWKEDQTAKYLACNHKNRRERTGDDFLYRRLTATHLKLMGAARSQFRAARGGVHLELYVGDLELYAKLKNEDARLRKGPRRRRSSSVLSAVDLENPNPLAAVPHGPATRKRNREETDDSPKVLEPNPAKRPKLLSAGEQEATRPDVGILQRTLSLQGPITRRQSQVLHIVLDRLSSGESSETGNIVQLMQALPVWKRREVYKLAVKQAGLDRRFASV